METVEAGPGTVRRITPSGCERRPGRSNGGQRSWSLAAGGLACAQHRIAQCLLRLARDSTIDCEAYRLTRRTAGCGPACPVVWEGRSCEAHPYPNLTKAIAGGISTVAHVLPFATVSSSRGLFIGIANDKGRY